jgi:hypothetical protein
MTMLRCGEQREPVYATGPKSQNLEELSVHAGEGPGVEALRTGRPVLAPDLSSGLAEHRWPAFAPAAVQCAARAIFAVPVIAGAIRLGVLDVYRRGPGPPSDAELTDALIFADAVLVLAIDERGGVTTGLKELIEVGFAEHRAHVQQAAGMVAAQLGVDIADALARLGPGRICSTGGWARSPPTSWRAGSGSAPTAEPAPAAAPAQPPHRRWE